MENLNVSAIFSQLEVALNEIALLKTEISVIHRAMEGLGVTNESIESLRASAAAEYLETLSQLKRKAALRVLDV